MYTVILGLDVGDVVGHTSFGLVLETSFVGSCPSFVTYWWSKGLKTEGTGGVLVEGGEG